MAAPLCWNSLSAALGWTQHKNGLFFFLTNNKTTGKSIHTIDEKLWSYNVLAVSMSSRCVNRSVSQKPDDYKATQQAADGYIEYARNSKLKMEIFFFFRGGDSTWCGAISRPSHVIDLSSSFAVKNECAPLFSLAKVFWVFRWRVGTAPSHQLFSRWTQYLNELFGKKTKISREFSNGNSSTGATRTQTDVTDRQTGRDRIAERRASSWNLFSV